MGIFVGKLPDFVNRTNALKAELFSRVLPQREGHMTTAVMSYYGTSIGKKLVMAVTGFIVFGFVTVHMLGNLQIYAGADALNQYAEFLHGNEMGKLLWGFRAVLLISTVLHITAATQLTLKSWAARPQGYVVQRYQETTYAARTMRWGGPIILLFVIYHLLHFTYGTVHPNFTPNVYNNVVLGFQVPWVSGFYIIAMLALGFHLYHGVWSMLQTMGLSNHKWNPWRRVFAVTFAVAVAGANISIPLAVLAGIVKPV